MSIIPDEGRGTQALAINPVLSYKYALRATPEQIKKMSRDQLQEMCLEQAYLLWYIISLVRNPLAGFATRLIAIDLFIGSVEKNLKRQVESIADRRRIYISGEYGIVGRLGISRNVVSEAFKFMEKLQVIKRDYVRDLSSKESKEYLDVTIGIESLKQPYKLRDRSLQKIERTLKATKKKETEALKATTTPQTPLSCPSCGSRNIICTCRDCGTSGYPEDFQGDNQPQEDPQDEQSEMEISEPPIETSDKESIRALLPIFSAVTNNPPEGPVSKTAQNLGSSAQIAQIVESTIEEVPVEMTEIMQGALSAMAPQEKPQPTNAQILTEWLEKRIGHGKIIWATGSPDSAKKYLAKPASYVPDFRKYLRGDMDHLYGSYLSRPDATTYVLSFDFDTTEQALNAKIETLLRRLAEAGAAPVYWQRLNDRGHLELYFDELVNANAARLWAIEVCPDLATVIEVYPANDKLNSPISWPLWQRKGNTVTTCQAIACLPGDPETIVRIWPKEVRNLVSLVLIAVTPASLIPPPTPLLEKGPVALQSELPQAGLSDRDVSRLVIEEFNDQATWDELIERCGGANRDGKFAAIWRGENSASVKVDADGRYACDYGRIGEWPKKMDRYGLWCLLEAEADPTFDRKADLAKRCAKYRVSQEGPAPAKGEKVEISEEPLMILLLPEPLVEAPITEEIQQILLELAPRAGTYTPSMRCSRCGSPFFYDLSGYPSCCRCLPFKGLTSTLLDRIKTYCKKSVSF